MTKEAKRIGRPLKPPAKGKRVSLGLKVTAEAKRHIDKAAQDSGRTQSQEAERLIESALLYAEMFKAMNTPDKKLLASVFRKAGYTPRHTPYGDIWLPQGHPAAEKSPGFMTDAEAEAFLKGKVQK
jgi:hypothetical protein